MAGNYRSVADRGFYRSLRPPFCKITLSPNRATLEATCSSGPYAWLNAPKLASLLTISRTGAVWSAKPCGSHAALALKFSGGFFLFF